MRMTTDSKKLSYCKQCELYSEEEDVCYAHDGNYFAWFETPVLSTANECAQFTSLYDGFLYTSSNNDRQLERLQRIFGKRAALNALWGIAL